MRYHIYCLISLTLLATVACAQTTPSPAAVSLKATYRQFPVGVALGGTLPQDYKPEELRLIRDQFACITPENCMKMQHIQPQEGKFDFAQADALVAFAQANGLKVCGHTLVWAKDERTPAWVFKDGDKPAGPELVLQRMRTHIQTLAGRYKGKIAYWDVVNEALDDGNDLLRPSGWEKAAGVDFIAKAFQWAHEADPDAILVYNDYNTELAGKRDKLVRLVRELLDKKVPIHAVGIQGHWEVDQVPFRDIEAQIIAIRAMGLKVVVSELDLSVVPRAKWWAEGGKYRDELAKFNPYPNSCPADLLQRQARDYGQLFTLFGQHAGSIARITFWDLHDGRSWLNDFPWKRTDYPLLFDRNSQPKPAFEAVIKAQ